MGIVQSMYESVCFSMRAGRKERLMNLLQLLKLLGSSPIGKKLLAVGFSHRAFCTGSQAVNFPYGY